MTSSPVEELREKLAETADEDELVDCGTSSVRPAGGSLYALLPVPYSRDIDSDDEVRVQYWPAEEAFVIRKEGEDS